MEAYHTEIIGLALDKMLNQESHFSICTVDKLAKIIGSNCSSHPEYKFLNSLHCVHYSEMSADLKAKLPEMIMNVLSSRFETGVMVKALAAVANGEIKDLPYIEDNAPPPSRLRLFKS